jgi:hypothetical protein
LYIRVVAKAHNSQVWKRVWKKISGPALAVGTRPRPYGVPA